jgi:hypothetical protein
MDDEILERVRALEERVLMLEAGHRAPLSYVDQIIAQSLDEKRGEPHEDARRRLEAFKRAEAEAERVSHLGPIDDFVRKLKRGEFDRLSNSLRVDEKVDVHGARTKNGRTARRDA